MKPLLIAGPSGSGKGTLIKQILLEFPDFFQLSVSHTTRNPRKEDTEGYTYHFISKQQFEEEIKNNMFYEYAKYNDNYYGTNKNQVD